MLIRSDRVLGRPVDGVERLRVGAADVTELVERGAEAVERRPLSR